MQRKKLDLGASPPPPPRPAASPPPEPPLTRIPGCRGRGRRRRARRRAWGGRATPSCARRRRACRPRRRWRRQGRGGGGRRARGTAPWLGSRSRARVRGLSAEAQRRREWISSRLLASRVRLGGREKRDKGRGKFLWRRKGTVGDVGSTVSFETYSQL